MSKPKFATDKCSDCGKVYQMRPNNTTLFGFTNRNHAILRHAVAVCPKCANTTRMYLTPETYEFIAGTGVNVVEMEFASEMVFHGYCKVHNLPLPKPVKLTPRDEKEIAFFRWELENMEAKR